jgi:hypothetical protein
MKVAIKIILSKKLKNKLKIGPKIAKRRWLALSFKTFHQELSD